MATVYVNGQPVELGEERLNLIQAADRVGVEIPRYCWHPALSVVASCRMCLVEVGEKKPDGSIVMQPKLLPACQTPAKEGTVVVTDSQKVKAAQAATLEYLLLNHPLDCPTCDQAGECYLQDYTFRYGRGASRLQEPKLQKPDKPNIGEHIVLFTDRCVMCSRCVRFTREISGTAELQIINRGSHSEIDIFPGMPCNNKLAGNVVDICPVGALCSKDFLYKQRVWWLEGTPSVCPNCSTGCNIIVDQHKDVIDRLRPRFNPRAQGDFMCDDGRFGWKYIYSPDRLKTPYTRHKGEEQPALWETILPAVRGELQRAALTRPETVVVVFSPWMTCEEAYLLASFLKELSPKITLAMGPVPVVGEDDHYPKDAKGEPRKPTKFTIRAEKCPNRWGVEAILEHFEKESLNTAELAAKVTAGTGVLYLVGGYPEPWLEESQVPMLQKVETLILQDLMTSVAEPLAHYVLPGGSFAEKDGTFVNHAGLAQGLKHAINGPNDTRPDGRILWELTGRRGLFHVATLRAEMAAAIPAFAALAGDMGEFGIRLEEQPAKVAGESAS